MIYIMYNMNRKYAFKCFGRQLCKYSKRWYNYDVIIVGGGHAGVEAATAAARMNCKTLLVTHKFETIGEMSCNPAFGGIGKGHLMREVDALDGICARICDLSGIQYKVLNRAKGPAVWGLRAQIDRSLYKKHMQKEIVNTPNLTIKTCSIEDLKINKNNDSIACNGIITSDGQHITSGATVISTGTFLRGQINIGTEYYPAGRIGDEPSIGLAKTLETVGFKLGRLKTGTPPRIDATTIDYTNLEKTFGDDPPHPFSFLNERVWLNAKDQCNTWLTHTNKEVEQFILENVHLSRHVNEEVRGPRYCPSIESKVLKFRDRKHQIWLEPEGFDSNVIYPNGISVTLPAELQQKLLNLIPGLENAKMLRAGYGVEYDFIDPRQLKESLETLKIENLFLAGQINGTTGYEEAAAQGIIAGINAAAKCLKKEPLIISRTEGYIGVLINDLTSLGTNEPYRMFTSRAEFRLFLRPDNADVRLTLKGYNIGCVSENRYQRFLSITEKLKEAELFLKSVSKNTNEWRKDFDGTKKNFISFNKKLKTCYDMLGQQECTVSKLCELYPDNELMKDYNICERLRIQALYDRAIDEQKALAAQVKKEEMSKIDSEIDYNNIKTLSSEEIEALNEYRPQTIGSATRIPGVTPSAIIQILFHMKQLRRQIKQQSLVDNI